MEIYNAGSFLDCQKEDSMDDNARRESSNPTRRSFLGSTGGAMAAVFSGMTLHAKSGEQAADSSAISNDAPTVAGAVPIKLLINGKEHQLRIDPRTTLLDCIREVVQLTGTKKGCDHGQCGACTVHV